MKQILKILLYIILFIVLITASWLATSQVAKVVGKIQNKQIAEVTVSEPTITFIGDSLTNGYYSYEGLQVDSYGYRQIITKQTNATSYNFAIGGYTSKEVLEQLNADQTLGQTNLTILAKNKDKPELKSLYGDTTNQTTLSQAIANSDYVISTMGANDVMQELLEYNEDGTFSIKKTGFRQGLDNIYARKYEIYSRIHQINPDVQIIDIGMYMAYPHFSDLFTIGLYPVLVYAEQTIFIEDEQINTTKVTIRDNMQADIKGYIDNPTDIHPNQDGYQIIANEVLKHIEEI